MKADFVSPLAIGISVCLHLSLLLLDSAEPLQQTEGLNQHPSGSFLVVALVEEKTASADILKIKQSGIALSDVPATSNENPGTSNVNVEAEVAGAIPQETYFLLSELEEPPRILNDIDQNPANLEAYAQGGRVVLQLWIDEQGNVVDQELVETMLSSVFVDNAMKNFAQAKFIAGIKYGRPVKSKVKVIINYDPLVS